MHTHIYNQCTSCLCQVKSNAIAALLPLFLIFHDQWCASERCCGVWLVIQCVIEPLTNESAQSQKVPPAEDKRGKQQHSLALRHVIWCHVSCLLVSKSPVNLGFMSCHLTSCQLMTWLQASKSPVSGPYISSFCFHICHLKSATLLHDCSQEHFAHCLRVWLFFFPFPWNLIWRSSHLYRNIC